MKKLIEKLKEMQELSIDFSFDEARRSEFKKDSDFIFKTITRIEKINNMQSMEEIREERESIDARIKELST